MPRKPTLLSLKKALAHTRFKQYRIVEVPALSLLRQSFPNTVPYSEGISFV